jgi:hypothetical protein
VDRRDRQQDRYDLRADRQNRGADRQGSPGSHPQRTDRHR